MPSTTRTFIAVAVPRALEPKLNKLQALLAAEAPQGRWRVTPPFHVTLAFLGDVDVTDLNDVCGALAETAAPFDRFELTLGGLGAFPDPSRPRVVWLGVSGPGLDALKALQSDIASAAARLRYPIESRPFHPHITIGRFPPGRKPSRDLTPVFRHYQSWRAGPFEVNEAVAFSSTVGRDDEAYAPLGRGPLLGRKPGTSP